MTKRRIAPTRAWVFAWRHGSNKIFGPRGKRGYGGEVIYQTRKAALDTTGGYSSDLYYVEIKEVRR